MEPDPQALLDLVRVRMPFGKYRGRRVVELPEPYLLWFAQQGFPRGPLGEHMAAALELKRNGLEGLLAPLIAADRE